MVAGTPPRPAREEQEDRRNVDVWEPHVLDWLVGQTTTTWAAVLESALHISKASQDQKAQNQVAAILKGNGWKLVQRRADGVRTQFYERDTRDTSEPPKSWPPARDGGLIPVTPATKNTAILPLSRVSRVSFA